MKPILDKKKSKIVGFGSSGLDLKLPKSAKGNLRKIRFNGRELVDISTLDKLYVTYINGVFELHARNVKGSQLVDMTYFDFDKLTTNNGIIKLKTEEEITNEELIKKVKRARGILKHQVDTEMGTLIEALLFTHKLLYVITKGFRTQNPQILDFIDKYLDEMDSIFDITDPNFKEGLINDYKKFRKVVKNYLYNLEKGE